jgi:prenyltransferase beta subunit
MDAINAVWNTTAFLLVHVPSFEFHTVMWFTALAAWRLATVLDKHNARLREAKLARIVAVFYLSFSLLAWLSSLVLV